MEPARPAKPDGAHAAETAAEHSVSPERSVSPPPAPAGPAPDREPGRRRLIAFRVLAMLPVLIFLVNGTNLLAPWVFVLSADEAHPEAHRWFFTVSAAADLFGLVSFAGLVLRPRLTALAGTIAMSLVVVMITIVPLQPEFLILLAFIVPAVLAYPYWRDLRGWRTWWVGVRRPLLGFAATVCVLLLVTSVVALRRQIVNDDSVAAANWWNDYAEHSADIALVGLIAVSRAPGSLLLRGVLSGVWIYLGLVAAFALPDATGSWGVAGGLAAIVIGIAFGLATWWDLASPAGRVPRQRTTPASST
ncbi:MAG: hypothetical protein ACXV4A_13880 [Actinomycetes bacterium]